MGDGNKEDRQAKTMMTRRIAQGSQQLQIGWAGVSNDNEEGGQGQLTVGRKTGQGG